MPAAAFSLRTLSSKAMPTPVGNLIGSLRAPEIIVAGSGRVDGSVVAHDLVVLGAVSGTVSARSVQLAPSAVVQAEVIHERIAIEAGAELEGKLQRKA